MKTLTSILKYLQDTWWLKGILYPLIMVCPPAFSGWIRASDLPKPDWTSPIKEFLVAHPIIFGIISFGWPAVVLMLGGLAAYLRDATKDPDALNENDLGILHAALDRIVGSKMERMGDAAAKAKVKPKSRAETFAEITQPDFQLAEIVDAIHNVFRADLERPEAEKLVVTLAEMGAKHIRSFQAFTPKDNGPGMALESLRKKDCCFSVAAASGNIVIIPDIGKELLKKADIRYTPGQSDSSKAGSIICYPVKHRNLSTTPYVIGIKAASPNIFSIKNKKRYETILKKFEKRISIEHSLKLLKKSCLP